MIFWEESTVFKLSAAWELYIEKVMTFKWVRNATYSYLLRSEWILSVDETDDHNEWLCFDAVLPLHISLVVLWRWCFCLVLFFLLLNSRRRIMCWMKMWLFKLLLIFVEVVFSLNSNWIILVSRVWKLRLFLGLRDTPAYY